MNYKLAKQLKDAGFPQEEKTSPTICDEGSLRSYDILPCYCPSLSELIETCGDRFRALTLLNKNDFGTPKNIGKWIAEDKLGKIDFQGGNTPEEAVAKLWLKLNKK